MSQPQSQIPVLDMKPEIDALGPQLEAAIRDVLRSTQFIMGPPVAAFETEIGAYLRTKHALGCNSGTDALVLALRALGIGTGDEVVTTPFTFFATAEAISQVGATPVFVDIDPVSFNMDPALVTRALTPRTKALLPVHLFGLPVEMDPLLDLARSRGLKVVEDVAQAMGAEYKGKKVGTLGDVGCYSFFPSKNLGCYGDGGLVSTEDAKLADSVKMLRAHGAKKKYFNEVLGYNSRLDTLQAAILRVKLPHLEAANDGRRRVAARYRELLDGLAGVTVPREVPHMKHVYHQYTLRVPAGRRDAIQKKMQDLGVQTMVYYPVPCHKLPIYAGRHPAYKFAEQAAEEVLSLPIWPTMDEGTQKAVVQALRTALA